MIYIISTLSNLFADFVIIFFSESKVKYLAIKLVQPGSYDIYTCPC